MYHKLDDYDIEELRSNMNDFDDLVFIVGCLVSQAYDRGYEEGYLSGKSDMIQTIM